MTSMRAYWRIPFWLRLAVILCLTVGAGFLIDGLANTGRHTANIVFIAVVLVVWGLIAAAEKRHRKG
jgi:membrane protein YdbS with pleckstrin-like domain